MASKTEMYKDMVDFYGQFEHLFKRMPKIDRVTYLNWVDNQRTYEEVSKANRYIFNKLMREMYILKEIWKYFHADAWDILLIQTPNQPQVEQFRMQRSIVYDMWSKRPNKKRKRKG